MTLRRDRSEDLRTYAPARGQRVFWALMSLRPELPVANEGILYRIRGPVDRHALRTALNQLWQGQDVLRTSLQNEGAFFAEVHPQRSLELEEVAISAAALPSEVERRMRQPFDPRVPCFLRPTLYTLSDDTFALSLLTHHVALDGYSFMKLLPEQLDRLYRAALHEVSDGPSWPTFRSIARQQATFDASPDKAKHLAYWRRALGDATLVLDIPTDHSRPPIRSLQGARVVQSVPAALRQQLERVSRAVEGHPIDALLASLFLFLHRYCRQRALTIGTTHANRRSAMSREVFGCLVESLPLSLALDPAESFRDLLTRVVALRKDAFAHLSSAGEEVLGELAPVDASRNPGYQVMLNYLPFSERDYGLGDLDVSIRRIDPNWTATDLSFDVIERPEGWELVLEYDVTLFEMPTAKGLLASYIEGLEAIREQLDAPVSEFTMVGSDSVAKLVELGQGPKRSTDETLTPLLAARAEDEGTALVLGSRRWSYEELWRESAKVGRALEAATTVAIGHEDPALAVIGMVGALRSRTTYLPFEPSLPAARIRNMFEQAAPEALVAGSSVAGLRPIEVEGAPATSSNSSRTIDANASAPEDRAYIIFTSGSTGVPKGVVATQANVAHQLRARQSVYGAGPGCLLSAYSFAFDAAVAGVFWTLASGGTLVLLRDTDRKDPQAVRAAIAAEGVEVLDIPPALYAELLASGVEGLGSLRQVILGGEALPRSLANAHFRQLPKVALFNEYGPTETTVFSTVHQVRSESVGTVPIGRPIERTLCLVVDESLQPVPRGAYGELLIGGAGVTEGYLDNPSETAARFISVPRVEGRLYRTGDLVRWNADGELEFHGRVDRQVQLRGHRVELREVELALGRLPDVAQSAVVAREESGELGLDAFVVARNGAVFGPGELRAALVSELPAPFVPRSVTVVPSIPRAASGKVDLDALPAPRLSEPAATSERWRSMPYTQTERQIVTAMAEVLGRDLGIYDDFFDAGGSSILAVRMLQRLHGALGEQIPLSMFVRSPSAAALAEVLHSQGLLAEEPLLVTFRPPERGATFWMLHPVGGHVLFAARFLDEWREPIGLFGLQARGLDGRSEPFSSMEEAVATYVPLIREQQPAGPYVLGGPSQGGLLALEVARALQALGEEVAMVVMFDSWAPGYPRRLSRIGRAVDHLSEIRQLPWTERRAYLRSRVERRLRRLREDWMEYRFDEEGDEGVVIDTLRRVQAANEAIADRYTPRYFPGRILAFRAAVPPKSPGYRFDDPTCGWSSFADTVEVVEVNASHHEMLDGDAVTDIARELEQRMRPLLRP
ncbi:MAG: amino acid adenylation domain-containing protein [Myxococcota bacterium]